MALATVARALGRGSFWSVCFLLLALPLGSQDQQSSVPPAAGSIKSTSAVVNVYAIVHDRHGHLVPNLDKTDFELRENGAPQQIGYFSRETSVPLSVGVLIDTSPSQGRLLAEEQDSAKLFLRSILQAADQGFVIHFDVDVELLQDFTNAPDLLMHAVDEMRINETGQSILPASQATSHPGATRLYDAVYLASNELMKTRYGRKVLVLVTDGEDQGSRIDWRGSLEAAEKADVIVYSIAIRDPDFYLLTGLPYHGSARMEKLSLETGGRTIRVESGRSIGGAFEQVSAELRAEYLLAYSPADSNRGGPFRTIQLRVPGHKYSVRTRHGYYARANP